MSEPLDSILERLDLVVLNTGVLGGIKELHETSIDEIQRLMEASVWSTKTATGVGGVAPLR